MKETTDSDNVLSGQGYRTVTFVNGAAMELGRKLEENIAVSWEITRIWTQGFAVEKPSICHSCDMGVS